MSDPTFGISITRIDNEPRPAVWSDMSVVGLIGTAPAAELSRIAFGSVGAIATGARRGSADQEPGGESGR